MATAPPNPAMLAAAIQAGVDPKRAQRIAANNQMLAQLLQGIDQQRSNLRSPLGLGVNLLSTALATYGKRESDEAMAGIQRQIAQAKFPNDPKAQLLYLTDPADSDAALAKRLEPQSIRPGNLATNTDMNGGSTYNPVVGVSGDSFYSQTPDHVSIYGQRDPSFAEQTARASQIEGAQHDRAQEGIAQQQIPIQWAQANAAQIGAHASATNAASGLTQNPNWAPPPGFVIGHPGAK